MCGCIKIITLIFVFMVAGDALCFLHRSAAIQAVTPLNVGQVIFMLHWFFDIWCW